MSSRLSRSNSQSDGVPVQLKPNEKLAVTEPDECIPEQCVCKRPLSCILCTSCKGTFFGRIRRVCAEHPNVHYLQDLKMCSKCKSKLLIEIDNTTLTTMNKMSH